MHALGRSDRYREVRLGELEVSNDAPRLKEHSLGSQGTMKLEAKLRRRVQVSWQKHREAFHEEGPGDTKKTVGFQNSFIGMMDDSWIWMCIPV